MSSKRPPVPMLDLAPEIELLWPEVTRALEEVVRSGRFILGPQVAAFESEVASCSEKTIPLMIANDGTQRSSPDCWASAGVSSAAIDVLAAGNWSAATAPAVKNTLVLFRMAA